MRKNATDMWSPCACGSRPNNGGGGTAGYPATPGGPGVPTLATPGGGLGAPGCSCPNIVTGLQGCACNRLQLCLAKFKNRNIDVQLNDSRNELTPGWRGWKYLSQEKGEEERVGNIRHRCICICICICENICSGKEGEKGEWYQPWFNIKLI